MNKGHLDFLASAVWAEMLETDLLPWLETIADLGGDVLEIGPGPGLTTDLLRRRAATVTAVEADRDLAQALAARLSGTNVAVQHADGTRTDFPSGRFSAATCFGVLHHMPSAEIQNRLFAEVYRVLRPGGAFVATDSVDSEAIRRFHVDDVFVPLDPETLDARLEAVGFTRVRIVDGEEKPEPVAWVIRQTDWRGIVQRLVRRYLPRPVLALGQQELYSVFVHGTGFALPIEGGAPMDGFFTSRIVAARDVREAKQRALSLVERDWRRAGRGSVSLNAQEIRLLEGRFRLRSGGGAAFYRSSDEDG